jgi:chitodextrinase
MFAVTTFYRRTPVVAGAIFVLALALTLFARPFIATADCVAPASDYGVVDKTITVPATATYRVWSRMAVPDAQDNTFMLSIDNSGCYNVGNSSVAAYGTDATSYFADDSSGWVNTTIDGGTLSVPLTAGDHTFQLIGTARGVIIDRIILTQDTACIPIGTGDNCIGATDGLAPTAPTNLSTTAISATSTTLQWTAATDNVAVDHYEINRDGVMVGTSNSLTYTDTGLTLGTIYNYTVDAVDAAGNQSSISAAKAVTTVDTFAPTTPSGVTTSALAQNSLSLSWAAASDDVGVDHYTVSRNGILVGTVTTPTFDDSGLSAASAYSYTVTAYDAAGNSSSSSSPLLVSTPDTGVPSAPTSFTAIASASNSVSLNWTAATDNVAVDHYSVARDGVTLTANQAGLSYADSTTAPGTTYVYAVVAWDAAGNASDAATATVTAPLAADVTPPTVPTGLTVSAVSGTGLLLLWTPSTDNIAVDHYVITRGGVVIGQPTTTSFADTALTPATSYNYAVMAVDAANNQSPASQLFSTKTLDTIAPTSPTGVVANTISETGLTLNWTAATDNVAVDHYVVSRAGSVVGQVTGTSFSDTGLTAATSYQYSVVAVDAAGNVSAATAAYMVSTIDSTAPTVPTGVSSSAVGTSTATVSWAAATDNIGVTSYDIYRGGSKLASTSGLSYTDTTVTPATTFVYTVVAIDAAGNQSAQSSGSTITTLTPPDATPPTAPGAVTATANSPTKATLSWTASTDNVAVDHYTIARNGSTIVASQTGLSYIDTSLTASTNYAYTVTAYDVAGNASIPATATVVTPAPPDTTPPTTPGALTAVANSATKVTLNWTASTDSVGVHHYAITRNGTIIVASQTALSFVDAVVASTSYTYTVTAYDTTGNASVPAPATVTTPALPDTSAPTVPGTVKATATAATSITVTWTAATDNVGVTAYNVYRAGVKIATTTSLTYANTGLVASTAYSYTVEAVDAAGNVSVRSAAATATTPALPDTAAPTVPANLKVGTVTGTSAMLTWAASTDNVAVANYELYQAGIKIATTSSLSYTVSGLTPATSYSYTIDAIDAAGNRSVQSTAVTTITVDTIAPVASTTFTAQASALGQVTLTWTAATDNAKVTGYKLTRAGALIASPTALTYTDTGLAANTAYTYTLTAVDAAGNSSAVKSATVTTPLDVAPFGSGFAGAYFNNTTLSGPAIGRLDPTINFNWGSGSPIAGIPVDNFSVRWTGNLTPATTGTYTFYTQSDDGIRLYLNGKLLIDHWTAGGGSFSATTALTAGTSNSLVVEYYEAAGTASASLQWSGPSIAKAVLPASVMSSGTAGLNAAYFANNSLTGTPAVQRVDANVNFDWVNGSPDTRIPVDNFSARWTGKITVPTTTSYTFYTDSDDGVRVWVNGQQVINNWSVHSLITNTSAKITLTAGTAYDIKVEYYEVTGQATMKLSWAYGTVVKTIIPATAFRDR